jgi:lipopolysaccharide export system protein LptC
MRTATLLYLISWQHTIDTPPFVISRLRCNYSVSYQSNESKHYNTGALLLLLQQVLLDFVTDSGSREQRNEHDFAVHAFRNHGIATATPVTFIMAAQIKQYDDHSFF